MLIVLVMVLYCISEIMCLYTINDNTIYKSVKIISILSFLVFTIGANTAVYLMQGRPEYILALFSMLITNIILVSVITSINDIIDKGLLVINAVNLILVFIFFLV